MKYLIGIIIATFSFFFTVDDTADDAIAALKQGKVSDLIKLFDEKVSIKLVNQEDVLSKSQAEANIKAFFDKHPVKDFKSSHASGQTKSIAMQYITGTLETTNGKFRVSILIRRNLISQFRIENDNE
jgi:hypothetical protein